MDYTAAAGVPGPIHLLHGCLAEAERCTRVAAGLDGLRNALDQKYRVHMTSVSDEIRSTCRLLWELADRSQVHMSRVGEVLNYLNVLLPCLSKTLRDIQGYYDDKTITRDLRWRTMYHQLSEQGKLPLPQRFMLYNQFLILLGQLLTRSPQFDLNSLDMLQERILALREERGIPRPPVNVGPVITQAHLQMSPRDRSEHWALEIFSRPLTSRTPMKVTNPRQSETHGPYFGLGHMMMIPSDSRILFRRLFDNGTISVSVYMRPADRSPFVLVRLHSRGNSLFSMKGVHELCIEQSADALVLKRWSDTIRDGKPWAVLAFITWEEMVLFHCAFVALKAQSPLSKSICRTEYRLPSEKRLFQARIIDDEFDHVLAVYRDMGTGGIRLHAAVWEGELQRCPVWTAFVTHQSKSPTWLECSGKHLIRLKDISLYVFTPRYRQERMRQNKYGAFEIYFHRREAAQKFKEVFYPPPAPQSTMSGPETVDPPSERAPTPGMTVAGSSRGGGGGGGG